MKGKSYLLLVIIIFVLSGSQCNKNRIHLVMVNNSEHTIYCYINNSWPGVGPTYPDTTLWGRTTHGYELIRPKSKQIFDSLLGKGGENTFGHLGDTLSFVIMDIDTIAAYSWDIINKEHKVLQRYDLSIHDLRKLSYTVYFPPTEAMRNMKMWPPYDTNR